MNSVDEIVGFEEPNEEVDRLAFAVLGAAIEVHSALGPGHHEAAYEKALCIELTKRGIPFVHQSRFSLMYKGQELAAGASISSSAGCSWWRSRRLRRCRRFIPHKLCRI